MEGLKFNTHSITWKAKTLDSPYRFSVRAASVYRFWLSSSCAVKPPNYHTIHGRIHSTTTANSVFPNQRLSAGKTLLTIRGLSSDLAGTRSSKNPPHDASCVF